MRNAYTELDDPYTRESSSDGPWDLVLRAAFEQFPWQAPIYPGLARFGAVFDRDFSEPHYRVLSRPNLANLLGASPLEFFAATFVYLTSAQLNNGTFDPTELEQDNCSPVSNVISKDRLLKLFKSSFAGSIPELRQLAVAERNADSELRSHDYNPLREKPYVQLPSGLFVAPAPRFIAERASVNALYYRGAAEWGDRFRRDLGHLLETYVGEQLSHVPSGSLTPEREYQRGQLSVDWILTLDDLILLVEVKSARVALKGRLDARGFYEDVKRDVGKGFTQITRTATLIRDDHPAFADLPKGREVRGIVVTAEPHLLINSPHYRKDLPTPKVQTVVLSLEELEAIVGYSLIRTPSEVWEAISRWDAAEGAPVGPRMYAWYQSAALTKSPENPLLKAAWDRLPWKEAAQRAREDAT